MNRARQILLIDRNRNMCEFLRRELEAEGYQVLTAIRDRGPKTWIDDDDPPDLLILDPDLPLEDGLKILERVRSRVPPIPVVVHSLFTELREHPTVAEADAFVEKGEDPGPLKQAVAQVFQRRHGK